MTSLIIGPSANGAGTPIGHTALFPSWYPKKFSLGGAQFVRSGTTVPADQVSADLAQFKKLNRKYSAPNISANDVAGFVIVGACGIAPGRTVLVGGQGCVYRSPDFGRNWTKITVPGFSNGYFYGLAGNGQGVWVGQINSQLWRSEDDGLTWSEIASVTVLNNIKSRVAYLGNSTFIVPGSSGGSMMRSTNNGVSWSSVAMPNGYSNSSHRCICGNYNGAVIVQAGHSSLVDNVYYRSQDYGATWSAATWFDGSPATVRVPAMQDEPLTPSQIAFGENGRVVAVRRKRHTEDVAGVWQPTPMVSTDNGLTFTVDPEIQHLNGSVQNNGTIESLCYVGSDVWLLRISNNETNGSQRDPLYTNIITFSTTKDTVRQDPPITGVGRLNSGTDARYPHTAIEQYDSTTGESVYVVIASSGNGNSHFVSISEEVAGMQAPVSEYTGGGGAGYIANLSYYVRVS